MSLTRGAIAALILACAAGQSAVAADAPVTGFKFISTSGDYIGQGLTQTFLPPEATFNSSGTPGYAEVDVNDPNNNWTIDFESPQGDPLARGTYPDASRYPFNSPKGPGLSMYGDGRGCNELKGWFRVREYAQDGNGNVEKLAIDFLQNCEITGPPLYGTVRINSQYPLEVPDVAAIAGPDADVFAKDRVALDGTQSFARRHGPLGYQWTQVGGPSVELHGAASAVPTFKAPNVPLEGATLRFELQVTDQAGVTSKDDVLVLVQNPHARRTEVSFHGDSGDYITGGQAYDYDTNNSIIQYSRNFDGGVSATITGDATWNFDSATPSGTSFGKGTYLNAQRYPFQDPDVPGLDLSGDGRGCNTLTGNFSVWKSQFDASGNPLKLDLTFEQHCEGSQPAAYGELLLNSAPHRDVARQLHAARVLHPRP
ncbi:MAG TPA: hypothetical protein VH328_05670 [Burkholderiaceae bacterium]|jgi:hypothetical protein|nr:hypothetical protein [Burkholderiaceae bacterium]